MNKFIVITSINYPTKGIKKFLQFHDYEIIVVGDKKSPVDWQHPGVIYLPVELQMAFDFKIIKHLPFNHYCRKMTGYLSAMANGADMIIDIDDDNIPDDNWSFPSFNDYYLTTPANKGFQNIYEFYSSQNIWPRGYPLELITKKSEIFDQLSIQNNSIGVWQALADGDPDVDAIYRLTIGKPCCFEKKDPVVLDEGTLCPFNSQNTAFSKQTFPLLYLPAFVPFRVTDILRGLVAQPVLWQAGLKLGFIHATVFQDRNQHDLLKDFESEFPCYIYASKVIEITQDALKNASVSDNLFSVYRALEKNKIVKLAELNLLEAWLNDCQKLLKI